MKTLNSVVKGKHTLTSELSLEIKTFLISKLHTEVVLHVCNHLAISTKERGHRSDEMWKKNEKFSSEFLLFMCVLPSRAIWTT